jgi:hypothetical protein
MALQRHQDEPDEHAPTNDPFAIDECERARRYDRLLALLEEWAVDDDAAEAARRETLAAIDATRREVGMPTVTGEHG